MRYDHDGEVRSKCVLCDVSKYRFIVSSFYRSIFSVLIVVLQSFQRSIVLVVLAQHCILAGSSSNCCVPLVFFLDMYRLLAWCGGRTFLARKRVTYPREWEC